jgi:hypothetical protein
MPTKVCGWLLATVSWTLVTRHLSLKASVAGNSHYQVESFDYGERLPSSVDVALSIAAATGDDVLLLYAVILRGDKAPEPKQIAETSSALEHGDAMKYIRESLEAAKRAIATSPDAGWPASVLQGGLGAAPSESLRLG